MKTVNSLHGMPSYESVGVPGVRAWASRREVVRVDAAMARGHGALPRAGTRGLSQAGRIPWISTQYLHTGCTVSTHSIYTQAAHNHDLLWTFTHICRLEPGEAPEYPVSSPVTSDRSLAAIPQPLSPSPN